MPCDLEFLTSVAWSNSPDGPWIPARSNEATFKDPKHSNIALDHKHHEPEQPRAEKIPTHRSVLLGINHSSAVETAI